MFLFDLLLLQAQNGGSSLWLNILLFASIPLIFYFFMIRPQAAKAKEEQNFIASIQKGEKIVTKSGIHGKVVNIDEKTITVEIDSNSKLKLEKAAISEELTKEARKS